MTRATWAWAAAAGVTLAAGVGCYSPAPYSPSYGYPTYPAAPPGAYPAAPGGTYVVPPGGTMPGTLGPATTVPGTGPTLAPPLNGGGDAPPSTYAPGNSVPNYEDPNAGDFESGNGFGDPLPDDGFQPPTGGANNGSPFYPSETAAPRPLNLEQAARPMSEGRYIPNRNELDAIASRLSERGRTGVSAVRPAGFEQRPSSDFGFDPIAAPEPADTASAEHDGFDYDRDGYAWLRGVVDYDPNLKSWHIIYGLSPDPADDFGGSLTLADAGHLADFRDNDVVLVEGRIDPAAGKDLLGKPLYRVTNAELLGRFE